MKFSTIFFAAAAAAFLPFVFAEDEPAVDVEPDVETNLAATLVFIKPYEEDDPVKQMSEEEVQEATQVVQEGLETAAATVATDGTRRLAGERRLPATAGEVKVTIKSVTVKPLFRVTCPQSVIDSGKYNKPICIREELKVVAGLAASPTYALVGLDPALPQEAKGQIEYLLGAPSGSPPPPTPVRQALADGFDEITITVTATGVYDDPHFKTWSGTWYDFMGECDLKLIQAPFFGQDQSLDINIRTKIRNDYSYVESAVLKLGDDTFEVSSYGDYFLNGVASAHMPNTVGGYPVVHTTPTKKSHVFEIQIDEDDKITLKTFKDMVSIILNDVSPNRFDGSLGMLGHPSTGKMVARDGMTVIEDPNAFADEWQIRADEPMLFNVVKGPQHPEKCRLPSPSAAKGRRLGESIALEAAIKACEKYASAEYKDMCVHDVMATGDLDLAAAGAF